MQVYGTVLGERMLSMALLAPAHIFIFLSGMRKKYIQKWVWLPLSSGPELIFWSIICHEEGGEASSFPQRCQTEIQSTFPLHWNMQDHPQLRNSYIQCHLQTRTWGQEMGALDYAWLWILFTMTLSKEFHLFPHAHTKWLFFLMCWSDTVKL